MPRSEAFLLGTPLIDLAAVLPLANKSEIVLANSAARLLERWCFHGDGWEMSELEDGHVRLSTTARFPLPAEDDRQVSFEASNGNQVGGGRLFLQARSGATKCKEMRGDSMVESVVLQMHRIKQSIISEEDSFATYLQRQNAAQKSGHPSSNDGFWHLDLLAEESVGDTTEAVDHAVEEGRFRGLDPLLRFMPSFVKQSCFEGHDNIWLMEHRMVAVLFVVANMKAKSLAPGHLLGAEPARDVRGR